MSRIDHQFILIDPSRPGLVLSRRAALAGLGGALVLSALGTTAPAVVAAARQPATPPAGGDAESGFLAMLGLVPDLLGEQQPPAGFLIEYADPATQLAAVGVPAPEANDEAGVEEWVRAVRALALPDPARRFALESVWRETFGFDLLQLDRSIVAGQPPGRIIVLQGRFDQEELRAAWTRSGYQPIDVPGAEAYSFAEDLEIVLESDVGLLALNAMNDVAILPDGTLVFTSTLDRLRATVATAAGDVPSLAERVGVRAVLTALSEPLVTGYLVAGEMLRAIVPADEPASGRLDDVKAGALATEIADRTAEAAMPPVRLAVLGLTAGGPLVDLSGEASRTPESDVPLARFLLALLMEDRAAAEAAVAVVDQRLAEGQIPSTLRPFGELFATWDLAVASDAPVLTIDLTFAEGVPPAIWINLLARRDLGFVAW